LEEITETPGLDRVTEPCLRAAPQLDIFIEILLGNSVNKGPR
jgi:hypothetical protein